MNFRKQVKAFEVRAGWGYDVSTRDDFWNSGLEAIQPYMLEGFQGFKDNRSWVSLIFSRCLRLDLMPALSLSHCILLYCLFNGAMLFCYSLSDGRVPRCFVLEAWLLACHLEIDRWPSDGTPGRKTATTTTSLPAAELDFLRQYIWKIFNNGFQVVWPSKSRVALFISLIRNHSPADCPTWERKKRRLSQGAERPTLCRNRCFGISDYAPEGSWESPRFYQSPYSSGLCEAAPS